MNSPWLHQCYHYCTYSPGSHLNGKLGMWNIWAGWCFLSQPSTLTLSHWYASKYTVYNIGLVAFETRPCCFLLGRWCWIRTPWSWCCWDRGSGRMAGWARLVSISVWTSSFWDSRLRASFEGLSTLRAGGPEVRCDLQCCLVVCLLFVFSLSLSFVVCVGSTGAELCWHQRDVSFCLDICSAQPHVPGRSEAVRGGVCSRRFNECRATPSIVGKTQAGQWRAPFDEPWSISSFHAGIFLDGCKNISLITKSAARMSFCFCGYSRPSVQWGSWGPISCCPWALWWQRWVNGSFATSVSLTRRCWHTWGPWQTGASKRYDFNRDVLQTSISQRTFVFPFPDESSDFWRAAETQTESGTISSCWSGNIGPSDLRSVSLRD